MNMGLFKRLKDGLNNLMEDEFPQDYFDDGEEYHKIPEHHHFLYSSLKGDFRLLRTNYGFCQSWKNFIVSRDWNGNKLFEIDSQGRAMAISPDGTKIVTINTFEEIGIYDAETGKLISSSEIEFSLSDLVWKRNGTIVGADSSIICVLNQECKVVKTIKRPDGNEFDFISGICDNHLNENYLVVSESNADRLSILDIETEQIIKEEELRNPTEPFYSRNDDMYWMPFEDDNFIHVFNENLEEVRTLEYEGKEGVKHAEQGDDDYECTLWTTLPVLSPDARRFLVNDKSGLLHLISATSSDHCYRSFSRDLIDYCYAVLWEDDENFVALLDDYRVVKMNIRGRELIFDYRENN